MKCPRCGKGIYKDWVDYYCYTCGIVDPVHPSRSPSNEVKEELDLIKTKQKLFLSFIEKINK